MRFCRGSSVALVAVLENDAGPVIVGGGRYVVVQPGQAEVAFAVVDHHQGQGIGKALMRHLVAIARDAGLRELIAEVLPDNAQMLKVFERSGLDFRTRREPRVVHDQDIGVNARTYRPLELGEGGTAAEDRAYAWTWSGRGPSA